MKFSKTSITIAGIASATVVAAVAALIKVKHDREKATRNILSDLDNYTICKTKPVVLFYQQARTLTQLMKSLYH